MALTINLSGSWVTIWDFSPFYSLSLYLTHVIIISAQVILSFIFPSCLILFISIVTELTG